MVRNTSNILLEQQKYIDMAEEEEEHRARFMMEDRDHQRMVMMDRQHRQMGENPEDYQYVSQLNNNVSIAGTHDFDRIHDLKYAISQLKNTYFDPNTGFNVNIHYREAIERRFLHIERELEGLLRRRIEFTFHDIEGPKKLDLSKLLNIKENQIIQLQRKINNCEEKLRIATARQNELEDKIVELRTENFRFRDPSYRGEKLEDALARQALHEQILRDLRTMRENFSAAAGIWLHQLKTISQKYPRDQLRLDPAITDILRQSHVQAVVDASGYITVEVHSKNTVEVPVQDTRTKMLINQLTVTLKRITERYPKILNEIDKTLVQYFQQVVIDAIEVDELDRLKQIIRYEPHTIRVENVYKYSQSKSMRVEFHLRVLIKALLEQLDSLVKRFNVVPDLDEGVIGMIRQEIITVVDIDDILRVFRVVPKIVEVEKVVQKIVERVVEVPKIVEVYNTVEKIVEVVKHVEVEKIVHVPVEVIKVVENIVEKLVQKPTIIEKIVEVPVYRDRIVEKIVEVPKIVEVEKIIERVVVNTEIKQVKIPENHFITDYKQVHLTRQVPVEVPCTKCREQRIKIVEVYIQKIVPQIHRIEVIKPVEIIKEVLVRDTHIEIADHHTVAIKEAIREVVVYRDKIVPFEVIVERPVEVVREVDKIVSLWNTETIIKEVEVIKEVLVPIIEIKEVEKIVNVIVEKTVEVPKIIDRYEQVPMIQQRLVTVPEEINKIVIERIHVPQIIPTTLYRDKMVEVHKYNEIVKQEIIYVQMLKIVPEISEKIVTVQTIKEVIKEVQVRHETIRQKLVQVPKVVEVEIQVPKLVVVPRIIQKIVQVPVFQEIIVEKIVQKPVFKQVVRIVKQIEIQEKIRQVQKIVFKQIRPQPIIIEKLVQVPVPYEKIVEKKQIVDRQVTKFVTLSKDNPKEILVEKIVTVPIDKYHLVEVERPTILVVEVPTPVNIIQQKAIPIVQVHERMIEVIQEIKVPFQTQKEVVKSVPEQIVQHDVIVKVQVPKIVQQTKIVVDQRHTEIIINQQRLQIEQQIIQRPYPVERNITKVVQKRVDVPMIIPINLRNQVLVQKIMVKEVPQVKHSIQHTNDIIEQIRDKIIPVYYKEEKIKQEKVTVECVKEVRTIEQQIKEVNLNHYFSVSLKDVDIYRDIHNFIDEKIKTTQITKTQHVAVCHVTEKIREVPVVFEKIMENIVIMPQIVEVVKHVYEICEDELGIAINVDIRTQEEEFKKQYGVAHQQLLKVLTELRNMRNNLPGLHQHIALLEEYLEQFDRFASVHRIVAIDRERIVEKDKVRPVVVPKKDSVTIRNELAYSILIEKLVLEIKRIKRVNPHIQLQLNEDLGLIFFTQFYRDGIFPRGGNFMDNLKKYTVQALQRFRSVNGQWTQDHELVINTILEQRFAMDNLVRKAHTELEKNRRQTARAGQLFERQKKRYEDTFDILQQVKRSIEILEGHGTFKNNRALLKIIGALRNFTSQNRSSMEQIRAMFPRYHEEDNRIDRELHNDNIAAELRNNIYEQQRYIEHLIRNHQFQVMGLQDRLQRLTEENRNIINDHRRMQEENGKLIAVLNANRDENIDLKQENNAIRQQNVDLRNEIGFKYEENLIMKTENTALIHRNQNLNNNLNALVNDIRAASEEVNAKRGEILNVSIEINALREQNMRIINENTSLLRDINYLEHERARKDEEIVRLRHELISSQNENDRLAMQLHALNEENNRLRNNQNTLNYNFVHPDQRIIDQNNELRQQNDYLRHQHVLIHQQNQELNASFEKRLQEMNIEINNQAGNRIRQLNDQKLHLEKQLTDQQQRCADLEKKLKESMRKIQNNAFFASNNPIPIVQSQEINNSQNPESGRSLGASYKFATKPSQQGSTQILSGGSGGIIGVSVPQNPVTFNRSNSRIINQSADVNRSMESNQIYSQPPPPPPPPSSPSNYKSNYNYSFALPKPEGFK